MTRLHLIDAFTTLDRTTARYVFRLDEADNFLVAKVINGMGSQMPTVLTVKVWHGDYDKTLRSWKTNIPYHPMKRMIEGVFDQSYAMLVNALSFINKSAVEGGLK